MTKTVRIAGIIALCFVFILIVVLMLIQTKPVQNYARKQIVSFLEKKLHTVVQIDDLSIDFPKMVVLNGIYIEDLAKDTLMAADVFKVDISMLRLLKSEIQINQIYSEGLTLNIKRQQPDTVFNYQFIVDAFSSDSPKTEKSDLKIAIEHILMKQNTVRFVDIVTGNISQFFINHLEADIDVFDPNTLRFDVPNIFVEGVRGSLKQTSPIELLTEITDSDSSFSKKTEYLKLTGKQIRMHNVIFDYRNEVSALATSFKFGELDVYPDKIDLENYLIVLNKFDLKDFDGQLTLKSDRDSELITLTTSEGKVIPHKYLPWKVIVSNVHLQNNHFIFDDNTKEALDSGMDFGHLDLTDLNLKANDFSFHRDTLSGSITQGSLKEKSGFILNSLQTEFIYTEKGVKLTNLNLKTPGSSIHRNVHISYPSIDAAVKNNLLFQMDIDLDNSRMKVKDILYFVPILKGKSGFTNPETVFEVHTKFTGSLRKLNFQTLKFKGFGNTLVDAYGTVGNVMDFNTITADLTVVNFSTTSDDVLLLAPPNSIPPHIVLPQQLSFNGFVKGSVDSMLTRLNISTTLGNASVFGTITDLNQPAKLGYDANITFDKIQMGKWMQNADTLLGVISGDFTIKGQGYEPATAISKVNGVITTVEYKNYHYKNIKLNGNLDKMAVKANGSIKDPNIHINFNADLDLNRDRPRILFDAFIDSIKTAPLHLTTEPVFYRGKIIANIPAFNADSLVGKLFVTESSLVVNNRSVSMDSLSLIADFEDNIQRILLKSDILDADVFGKYKVLQLGDILIQSIQPYYAIQADTLTKVITDYDFSITAVLKQHNTLRVFMPELRRLEKVQLNASFSDMDGWNAKIRSPFIAYGETTIADFNVDANSDVDKLKLLIDIKKISAGEYITMSGTRLTADIADQHMDFAVRIGDRDNKDRYIFQGSFEESIDKIFSLRFSQDSMMLNYDPWMIDPENLVRVGQDRVEVRSFDLNRDNQHLIVQNTDSTLNSPVSVQFKDFKLATFTGFFQTDSLIVDGTFNGKIVLNDLMTQPNFTTDLMISNLAVNRDTIGNLHALVNNTKTNVFSTNITLTGRGNNVSLVGDYHLKPNNKSNLDFILDIKHLQMESLEGASFGNVKDSKGHVSGKVNIGGTINTADISGNLEFFHVSLMVTKLQSVFKVDNGQLLAIDNTGLRFNNFTIKDIAENRFVINGTAFTKNYINYNFDLRMNASNFKALNSTKADNQQYFGQIYFDTNMRVTGTEKSPVIDGTLRINEGTILTIVLPQSDPGMVAREGVVVFVDKDMPVDVFSLAGPLDSLNTTSMKGMDVSVNIEIDKKAELTLVIDEGNNDMIRLKGEANLNGGIDRSGKVTLTGTYVLQEGTYEMSFNFIERSFKIQQGSKITWNGEPTDASMDISAVYVANTSAVELVQDQIPVASTDLRYRQRLPFEVHLSMKGQLMKPELSFEIKLPKESTVRIDSEIASQIELRLSQLNVEPSELNKQIFSLLILNRFTSQNPFESAGGGINAGTMARQSVSKILAQQLNNLADDLIAGVDINFDIISSEDYTSGSLQNKTDLNVGVSKRLFSERLNVSVGTNIALEGGQQNNSTSNIGASNVPNLNIEYLLSKDGRYMLRAYRRNQYEGIVEGFIIETGIGFVMSVEYDRFREIFERRRSNKDLKKLLKSEEQEENPGQIPADKKDVPTPAIKIERKDDEEY